MTDELVDLLARATADTIVRIEVWPNGIGNDPPPREFERPANTVHVDPIDSNPPPPPPRPTKILYVPAGTTKNIREAAGTAATIRLQAPEKTAITVYTDTFKTLNGFTWREIQSPYAGAWVAEEVLTATKPNPSTPPDAGGGNKMGIHWAQGSLDHNSVLAMLRRLYLAGTPVPCVLVLGTPGNVSPRAIKAVSPSTIVLVRPIDGGNYDNRPGKDLSKLTYADGVAFYSYLDDKYVAPNADFLLADYIVPWNEYPKPDSAHPAIHEFERGAMDEAYRRRRKITIGNYNPGWPELPGGSEQFNDYWTRPANWNNLRQAIAQGHALALHSYDLYNAGNWTGPFDCLRHEQIWKLLPGDIKANLPLFITEFGDALLLDVGDDTFVARMKGAYLKLKATPYVKGVAIWTLGISSEIWRESNWSNHMLAYERFMRNPPPALTLVAKMANLIRRKDA